MKTNGVAGSCGVFALAILSCCVVSAIRAGEPVGNLRSDIKAQRILFLGNSITRHGPAAKIGWTGDWGMAATAQEKDFVHILANSIAELTGHKAELRIANVADFERNFGTFDLNTQLKDALEFKADLVIVALGENVPALASDEVKTQFKNSFTNLLTALKNNGQPALFVRGCFWTDKTKDDLMQQACATSGGVFVDIGTLGKDESNFARSERKIEHAGVAAHPGDKGMKAIADAIVNAMKSPAK